MFRAGHDREEVIAGEQAGLTGKLRAAVRDQKLCFAHAARVQQNLAGQGIDGGVLGRNANLQISERHPRGFAAPSHVQQIFLERQQLQKRRAGQRRLCGFTTGSKGDWTGGDREIGHVGRMNLPLVVATIFPSAKIVSPRRMVRRTVPPKVIPTYGLIL